MDIELFTCSNSPESKSAKMFLDLKGVEYEEIEVSDKTMTELGFKREDMPMLLEGDEVKMQGFNAERLNELFS